MAGLKVISSAGDITTMTNQLVENTGGEIFGINGEGTICNPKPSLLDDRWMEKPWA